MEASSTAKPSRKKAPARYTERAFLGRRCEDAALAEYGKRGYVLFRRNFRRGRLEGDLLLFHPRERHYLLVEVKGRIDPRFGPGESLAGKKLKNLTRLAEGLLRHLDGPLHVELMEVVGSSAVPQDSFRFFRFRVF